MDNESLYAIAETRGHVNRVIFVGSVYMADYENARVKVESAETITGWIPWLAYRAGGDVDWAAPEVGEQVLVLSPSGDPANGVCLGAIYSDNFPQNANVETVRRTTYKDGAIIEYDRENHGLKAELPEKATVDLLAKNGTVRILLDDSGRLELVAKGGITIDGDITHEGNYNQNGDYSLTGDMNQTGEITSTGDHMAGPISLQNHKTSAVEAGSDLSGPPVP